MTEELSKTASADDLLFAPGQKQPGASTVVWQHNRLAEARYELSPREQKLLLYVIAMIEPEDDDFKRYTVDISRFAELANLEKRHLYMELRDIAESLKSKVLVIPNHWDEETGKHVDLLTNWFSDAFVAPNGEGYFGVEISRSLKPYLLQVKREFHQFRLQHVMQMRSGYAIRLYQFLKRWEFRKKIVVPVTELREIMGAVQVGKRGKVKTNLSSYSDFKRRAIQPAIDEINEKSELDVKYEEVKAKGSKAVESIGFSIGSRSNSKGVMTIDIPRPPQMELSLSGDVSGEERLIGEIKVQFGLSAKQADKVREYCSSRGASYVLEKARIVLTQKSTNAARSLLAALRDDWQMPVKIGVPTTAKKKKPAAPSLPDEVLAKGIEELQRFRESKGVAASAE